jgi:hypothetical protein
MSPKRMHPKLLLLLLMAVCSALLALSFVVHGYEQTWSSLGIIPFSPHFADARVITAGAESHAMGYDPLLYNPRDPWGRQMNYPRIWQSLFYLGINQQDTIYFEIIFVVLFFAGIFLFIGDIRNQTAWVMAGAAFSPAVLVGIERGNTDLVIFFLLALALAIVRRSTLASATVIAFAFLLKLFPLFAVPIFLKENRRSFLKYLVGSAVFVGAYVLVMHNEMKLVRMGTPTGYWLSYGIAVLWVELGRFIHVGAALRIACYAILIGIAFSLVLVALRRSQSNVAREDQHIDAFRVGAAIYLGTFLLGTNFDYRLVFLLFTIPQLMQWIANPDRSLRRIAAFTLVCILVAQWSLLPARFLNTASTNRWHVLIDLVSESGVFCGLAYLFAYSAPEWLKSHPFHRKPALPSQSSDPSRLASS